MVQWLRLHTSSTGGVCSIPVQGIKIAYASQSRQKKKKSPNELFSITTAYMVAQLVKNLPAIHEIQVLSLGHEAPLEKGIATCARVIA